MGPVFLISLDSLWVNLYLNNLALWPVTNNSNIFLVLYEWDTVVNLIRNIFMCTRISYRGILVKLSQHRTGYKTYTCIYKQIACVHSWCYKNIRICYKWVIWISCLLCLFLVIQIKKFFTPAHILNNDESCGTTHTDITFRFSLHGLSENSIFHCGQLWSNKS
jgi:hypothetical protein